MSEPFIAQIKVYGTNFPPRGWAHCNGQLMPIAQNTALFSLIGTTYGGNGQTTFGLPDLRGRAAMHPGHGPGLTPRVLGEVSGSENVTLTINELPAHNHGVQATTVLGNTADPAGAVLARGNFSQQGSSGAVPLYSNDAPNTVMAQTLGIAGNNQPHDNMMPSLTLNYCIALQGIFPSRN